jgi:hypothetical protein
MPKPLAVNEFDASVILSTPVQTLRNHRHLRKGPPYLKLGKAVRYLVEDLERYLVENRVDPSNN